MHICTSTVFNAIIINMLSSPPLAHQQHRGDTWPEFPPVPCCSHKKRWWGRLLPGGAGTWSGNPGETVTEEMSQTQRELDDRYFCLVQNGRAPTFDKYNDYRNLLCNIMGPILWCVITAGSSETYWHVPDLEMCIVCFSHFRALHSKHGTKVREGVQWEVRHMQMGYYDGSSWCSDWVALSSLSSNNLVIPPANHQNCTANLLKSS